MNVGRSKTSQISDSNTTLNFPVSLTKNKIQ